MYAMSYTWSSFDGFNYKLSAYKLESWLKLSDFLQEARLVDEDEVSIGDLPSQIKSSSTIVIRISSLDDDYDTNPIPS